MSSPEAPSPPPPARGPARGNPLTALLRRLRAFLNAPLLDRLERMQAEALAAQQAQFEALIGRFDQLKDTVERRADRFQDTVERRIDLLQVVVDRRADGLGAMVDRRADGLEAMVDRRAEGLEARGDAALGEIGAVRALAEQLPPFAARQDDHAIAQAYVARQTTEAGRRAVAGLERTEAALATFSARFDELDIKSRPLIPYDEESWAIRVREGYILAPRTDPVFSTALADASSGGLEPGTRRVLRALLEPGMGVADVGANIGLLTLACAFAVGPSGRVWSFEPEARLRAQLVKTLHLNGLSWVALSAAAVGAQAGRARFNVSPIIGHSSLHPLPDEEQAQARTLEVEVTTLDAAIPAGQRLDVVKIDVEGAELDVLAGMTRLLAQNADLAVVAEYGPSHLARLGVSADAWFGAFAAHGLAPHLIEEPFGACRALGDDLASLAGLHSANIVFVRPGEAAQARLPQA